MALEFVRRRRFRPSLEIGGRADDDQADARLDTQRDHALGDAFAEADAGIEALFDDIDQPVRGVDLQLQIGILFEQRADDTTDDEGADRVRHINPHLAERRVAVAVQSIERCCHLAEGRIEMRDQQFAGFRQRDAARRAVEQANTDPVFEIEHGMTDCGSGDAPFLTRLAKALMPRDSRKGRKFGQFGASHC